MNAIEIIERIMTQHWDMAACPCWICKAGRALGYKPREVYLERNLGVKVGRVIVEEVK